VATAGTVHVELLAGGEELPGKKLLLRSGEAGLGMVDFSLSILDSAAFPNAMLMIDGGDLYGILASTPREAWLLQYGLPPDGSLDGADDADPDGDGIPNAFERALGLNPRVPNHGWPIDLISDGAKFSMTYPVARGQWDLVVRPLSATSLDSAEGGESPVWSPVVPVLVDDSHPDYQLWRASMPQEADAGFLRLDVQID
jgi:hypothetical protein